MPKELKVFEHESLQNRRAIVTFLAALQEGFSSGKLVLSDPEGEIELHPRGLVRFEIRALRKRDRFRLVLRFGWKGDEVENGRPWPLTVKGGVHAR
jgi:amphi-Trp domain-containing protein